MQACHCGAMTTTNEATASRPVELSSLDATTLCILLMQAAYAAPTREAGNHYRQLLDRIYDQAVEPYLNAVIATSTEIGE